MGRNISHPVLVLFKHPIEHLGPTPGFDIYIDIGKIDSKIFKVKVA